MMRSFRRIITSTCLAAMFAIAAMAGMPHVSAAGWVSQGELPPPPVTRQLTIDGRVYKVALSVLRFTPGAKIEGGPDSTVTATATISIQDGAILPAGLKVSRIRFERLFGSNRVFTAPMRFEGSSNSEVFELDDRIYRGDITNRTKGVRRLKATVRVELEGRVFMVNFGTVPVSSAGLFP